MSFESSAPAPEAVVPTATNPTDAPQTNLDPTSEAALKDAAKNGTPEEKKEAKKMLKEITYKANGQSYTEKLGFEIPEDQVEWMQKQLSLNKGAQKSMQQYSQLETEIKAFAASMKTDTKGALQRLGIDPKQFAAMMLEEELKDQAMSPEERERNELRAKLKNLEDERNKEKEEFTKKELERTTQVEYERISTKMEAAIKTSGLPQDPAIVKRMAHYMLIGNEYGVRLEPEDVVEVVRDEMFAELKSLVSKLGADKVEELLGKEALNSIRKRNVAKATKTTPATAKAATKSIEAPSKPKEEQKASEKQSIKSLFGI